MPYSDNLYSAIDDSDGEDLADQLSPSDGFTSPSSTNFIPHVPNVIVQDPTLQQQQQQQQQQQTETAAESKAREASEEGRSSTQGISERYVAGAAYSRRIDTNLGQDTAAPSFTSLSTAGPQSSFSHTYSQSSASRTPLRTLPSRGRTPSVYSDAPPAYTPSPTSPLSPSSHQEHSRNYSTFSPQPSMGIPDVNVEQEGLLAREPESMADHPGDEESGIPVWRRHVRRRLPTWLNWKIALVSLGLLILSAGFLVNAFRGIRVNNDTPAVPQDPALPVDGPEKPVGSSPNDQPWYPFQPTVCKEAEFHYEDQVLPLVFNQDRNVAFVEEVNERTAGVPVRVAGYVQVREVDQGGDPRILLEVASNDEDLPVDFLIDEDAQSMKVRAPAKFDSSRYGVPCVEIRATIFVPRDGDIRGLSVGVIHLDVSLLDSLSLRVADFSKISSVVGDIVSAASYPPSYEGQGAATSRKTTDFSFVPAKSSYNFDSRVIEVSSTTGKIHGNWPLFDMLGLHTTSGDIKASITPKEVLKSHPKPAVLSLSSISGNIQAAEPIHDEEQIPTRDYLVDIKSTSGELHCSVAIGAGTHLKSTSSDIIVDLKPVINKAKVTPEEPAQLETITTSGKTAVHVLEPLWFEGDGEKSVANEPKDVPYIPIGNDDPYDIVPPTATSQKAPTLASNIFNRIQATHKSSSGGIGLTYPQSWEGNLFAESMSGSLKVRGKDARIIRKDSGWPRSMHARKGDSDSNSLIRVHSLSGNLDATLGDQI